MGILNDAIEIELREKNRRSELKANANSNKNDDDDPPPAAPGAKVDDEQKGGGKDQGKGGGKDKGKGKGKGKDKGKGKSKGDGKDGKGPRSPSGGGKKGGGKGHGIDTRVLLTDGGERICVFYQVGQCTDGDQCRYAHEKRETDDQKKTAQRLREYISASRSATKDLLASPANKASVLAVHTCKVSSPVSG